LVEAIANTGNTIAIRENVAALKLERFNILPHAKVDHNQVLFETDLFWDELSSRYKKN